MFRKVVVLGLDGLDPRIVDRLLARGELPHLDRLRQKGGYTRVATTYPAQTPVAWSTFATGTNPGGHGIFDFLRRDPQSYTPDLGLNRYERKSAFLPPKAINLRGGTPIWELLSRAGVQSSILRCPCTYPPDKLKGRMLSGMGVPDLRGGLGTSTFYTERPDVRSREAEQVVQIVSPASDMRLELRGPYNPKTGSDAVAELGVQPDPSNRRARVTSKGNPGELELPLGEWSDWLKLRFKLGKLQSAHGMVSFFLVGLDPFELYVSPVNFDPDTPLFPISSPWDYAGQLEDEIGTYYTTGMAEDHGGLINERFDENAFLDQCARVLREREAMLAHEQEQLDEGLLYCLFDTPDRIQHMFWRFDEANHPANRGREDPARMRTVIEEHYRECDGIVGRAMEREDEEHLFIVLSDHGFGSFQRGFDTNAWLRDHGYLALRSGAEPGEGCRDLLLDIDWERTQAYAVGLGSIYLNLRGREGQGIVDPSRSSEVARAIATELTGVRDPDRDAVAIRGVRARDEIWTGPFATESPDLLPLFENGYRVSWQTGMGGVGASWFEDNVRKWSGDHILDPPLVPGVLFMNRPFDLDEPDLRDLAPTIAAALGIPAGSAMEGNSVLH